MHIPVEKHPKRPALAAAGIAVAVVLAAALLAVLYALKQAAPEAGPATALSIEGDTGPAPEVSYIWTAGVELSAGQQRQLRDLEKRQQRELGPVLRRLEKAADALDAELSRRTEGSSASQRPASESEAGRMRELSEQANRIRDKYWEEALALLTPEQRSAIEEKRRKDWVQMLERLGIPGAPPGGRDAPSRP
mgnify:CR=1 FL=1